MQKHADYLEEILQDSLQLTGRVDKEAFDTETAQNMWGFAFSNKSEDGLEMTSEPIVSFMQEVIDERAQQVQKLLPKQGATFYFWYDEDDGGLRFNILSGLNRRPPFACNLRYVQSLQDIAQLYVDGVKSSAVQGLNPGDISMDEVAFVDGPFDWEKEEEEIRISNQKFVQNIYVVNLPSNIVYRKLSDCVYLTDKHDFDVCFERSLTFYPETMKDNYREEFASNLGRLILTPEGLQNLTVKDVVEYLDGLLEQFSGEVEKSNVENGAIFYYWFDELSGELRYAALADKNKGVHFENYAEYVKDEEKIVQRFFDFYTQLYEQDFAMYDQLRVKYPCNQEVLYTGILEKKEIDVVVWDLPLGD